MFSPKTIELLQKNRQQIFPNYKKLTVNRQALDLIANLFLNPDCQSDIDLKTLPGEKIFLSTIGEHIITAAPSTLAQYAKQHGYEHLTAREILRCFALDHADDISRQKIDLKKNPAYALAHLLTIIKVKRVYEIEGQAFLDGKMKLSFSNLIFKKVKISPNLKVSVGQEVYQHFGVAVGVCTDKKLKKEILKNQLSKKNIASWRQQSFTVKTEVIDFSDGRIFQEDVAGKILHPQKVAVIKNPGDLEKGKIKFQK